MANIQHCIAHHLTMKMYRLHVQNQWRLLYHNPEKCWQIKKKQRHYAFHSTPPLSTTFTFKRVLIAQIQYII